ncbi:MAG: hypothetical protein ACKOU6_06335 [Planctomycetota bacterium]
MNQHRSRRWLLQSTAATSCAALLVAASKPPSGELVAQVQSLEARSLEEQSLAVQRAVRRGMDWLVKAFHRDGGCGIDLGQTPDIGCSAMAGLSLLAQGNTPREGAYSREVRQVVAFLLRAIAAMPADDITAAQQTQLQTKIGRHVHSFLATIFLSQAVGEGNQVGPTLAALRRVVEVVVSSQSRDGHWGTNSWAPLLGTVLGWVALRAAHFAGVEVGASPDATARFLSQQLQNGLGAPGSWMHGLYKNATGVRVLYALGREGEPAARRALQDVIQLVTEDSTAFTQAGGEEFLAFHLITETLLQKGGADWQRWYPVVRDKVIAVQNGDGSWSGAHCITSRTFCTAAALLVLSAPLRYLPISQV